MSPPTTGNVTGQVATTITNSGPVEFNSFIHEELPEIRELKALTPLPYHADLHRLLHNRVASPRGLLWIRKTGGLVPVTDRQLGRNPARFADYGAGILLGGFSLFWAVVYSLAKESLMPDARWVASVAWVVFMGLGFAILAWTFVPHLAAKKVLNSLVEPHE